MTTVKIAASVLAADFARLGDQVQDAEAAGADWIHFDVMDGCFVPNISIGIPVLRSLRKVTRLPLDVHLMIVEPERYLAAFAEAGADYLTVHAEATPHLHRAVQVIRDLGVKAGVSVNPGTSLTMVEEVIAEIDLLLVMSVNPGFGGQYFLPSMHDKLRRASEMLATAGSAAELEVDGGINAETAYPAVASGATVLVAGSAIFRGPEVGASLRELRKQTMKKSGTLSGPG
ncbi:MAG: ribulose-phosphate 3-epimerase [Chloroflexota bacterium]|nr:ribulose-phosphate 3-epimerase [Chloroflexota bacterium]